MRKRNHFIVEHRAGKIRWKRVLIAVLVVSGIYRLSLDTFGEMGLMKYSKMGDQYNDLTSQITKLKLDNRRLRKEIHALQNDPDYLETIARDKLSLAREGEIVYYYGER